MALPAKQILIFTEGRSGYREHHEWAEQIKYLLDSRTCATAQDRVEAEIFHETEEIERRLSAGTVDAFYFLSDHMVDIADDIRHRHPRLAVVVVTNASELEDRAFVMPKGIFDQLGLYVHEALLQHMWK